MLKVYRNGLALLGLILSLGVAAPVQAQAQPLDAGANDWLASADKNVFFFGGRFHEHWFWDTFIPFGLPYEDNYFVGAGAQALWRTDWSVSFGGEVGVGARIGLDEPSSLEAWAGLVTRFDGIDVFDTLHFTPSLVLGLSAVTDTIGIEKKREQDAPKSAGLLVYMAPELAVNTIDNPDVEYFFRIQHRSGGLGLIMSFDGSNAATAGVRFKF